MPHCPGRATLESFLAGSLGDRDEDALSTHVEECAECQRELDELVSCRSASQAPPIGETRAKAKLDPSFQKRL
jgi:hypothetical protein